MGARTIKTSIRHIKGYFPNCSHLGAFHRSTHGLLKDNWHRLAQEGNHTSKSLQGVNIFKLFNREQLPDKSKTVLFGTSLPPPYHGPTLLKWHTIYLIVAEMSPMNFIFIHNEYWCAQKQLHRKRLAKC